MATVQTRLDFNVRKKLPRKCKILETSSYCEKEQSEDDSNFGEKQAYEEISRSNAHTKSKRTTGKKIVNENDSGPSPRKIRKSDGSLLKSPSKSPRRNSQDENLKSPRTPGSLVKRLQLGSPPSSFSKGKAQKHEDQGSLMPKKLFSDAGCTYQLARQAFHGTIPNRMPGREQEQQAIASFLRESLAANKSGSLYISGAPGTGKTASLMRSLEISEVKSGFKALYINCTSMKNSSAVFSRIAEYLKLKTPGKKEKEIISQIEECLHESHKMILLILDELDQLDSKNQSVLYTIFEWAGKSCSKLVLVGIANALDLTDRILPRLQARPECKPQLIHFQPYTKQQIAQILTDRLNEARVCDVFSPPVIQLLAGKVAATSGDVRRALDIARRLVDMAEREQGKQVLQPTSDHGSNPGSPRKSPRKCNQLRGVNLKQLMCILNNVYSTSSSLESENKESFPLQQRILLCCLLLILQKGKNKAVTTGRLYEVFCRVCKKRNLLAVGQSEFLNLCTLIETRGALRLYSKGDARLTKVVLQWDEGEVSSALQDQQLMTSILNDVSCLSG